MGNAKVGTFRALMTVDGPRASRPMALARPVSSSTGSHPLHSVLLRSATYSQRTQYNVLAQHSEWSRLSSGGCGFQHHHKPAFPCEDIRQRLSVWPIRQRHWPADKLPSPCVFVGRTAWCSRLTSSIAQGVLNYQGNNTLALAIWAQDSQGAEISNLHLEVRGQAQSTIGQITNLPFDAWTRRSGAY